MLTILEAALTADNLGYAARVAEVLLEVWPNDIQALFGKARALAHRRPSEAVRVLRRLLALDACQAGAWGLLGELLAVEGSDSEANEARFAAYALGRGEYRRPPDVSPPPWLRATLLAMQLADDGRYSEASSELDWIRHGVTHPVPWHVLLEATWRSGEYGSLRALATAARNRWTDAVLPDLLLGDVMVREGMSEQGLELLHEAASEDPVGLVPRRIWGGHWPYEDMWPRQPDFYELPGPIPPDVSAALGLNRLVEGRKLNARVLRMAGRKDVGTTVKSTSPAPDGTQVARDEAADGGSDAGDDGTEAPITTIPPEILNDIEELLSITFTGRSSRSRRKRGSRDSLSPVHVILSHYGRLEERHGTTAAAMLARRLDSLAQAIQDDTGVPTELVFVDLAHSLADYGLRPLSRVTPWGVKGLIGALDEKLERMGAGIDSILIIGGDDVIPFHRLPNPVDDADREVYSDNPYAARDENYFAPDRPIGRFPDPDTGALVTMIDAARRAHHRSRARGLARLARFFRRRGRDDHRPLSIGYTAGVWVTAAERVYGVIGRREELRISPPVTASLLRGGLEPARLGYFNLHGVIDSPYWYGQRAPGTGMSHSDYPIALRPEDVPNGGKAPQVVFTEACYGAHILGKSPDEALALRFMASGTLGVIGATCIAYGSVGAPLIGADLLARRFWERLAMGRSLGEALHEARLAFAYEMSHAQGYLDDLDQKTLIGFVLYGDPTVKPIRRPKVRGRAKGTAAPGPGSWQMAPPLRPAPLDVLDEEAIRRVKARLARYLPGIHQAQVRVRQSAPPRGAHAKGPGSQRCLVVTLSTTAKSGSARLEMVARVTVSPSGHILKLALSR